LLHVTTTVALVSNIPINFSKLKGLICLDMRNGYCRGLVVVAVNRRRKYALYARDRKNR
jgi:hypothetical protein